MYKLEVKLKQHTPLIHFQWEHQGATLRASEVKPKLDRFILEKLGKEGGDSKENCYKRGLDIAKNKGWLIGESKALDYKARIVVNDKPVESLITARYISETSVNNKPKEVEIYSSTSYFAQEEKSIGMDSKSVLQKNVDNGTKTYNFNFDKWKEIDKKGLEWKEIILSITSFYDDLGTSIEGVLREFFICTNFGTRSTKGFGSFEVVSKIIEEKFVKCEVDPVVALKENFDFVYKCKSNFQNNFVQIFNKIRNDYQLIKSGINNPFNPNAYKKSKLFLFGVEEMKDKPRWEKRRLKLWIKEGLDTYNKKNNKKLCLKAEKVSERIAEKVKWEYNAPSFGVGEEEQSWKDPVEGYTYYFLRAMLGIGEQYEFKVKNLDRDDHSKYRVFVKIQNENIQRYQSPLLFKVINNDLYLIGNEVNTGIQNSTFSFDIILEEEKTEKKYLEKLVTHPLKTPEEFSLSDFMKFVMTQPEFVECYEDIKNNTEDAKIQLYHHRPDH